MKSLLSFVVAFALTVTAHAADVPDADALWKNVDDALLAMRAARPDADAKSRQEAFLTFKPLINSADKATAFIDASGTVNLTGTLDFVGVNEDNGF